jgi:hypothetical protein
MHHCLFYISEDDDGNDELDPSFTPITETCLMHSTLMCLYRRG